MNILAITEGIDTSKYKEGKKGTNKGTDKDVNANYCVDNVLYNVSV